MTVAIRSLHCDTVSTSSTSDALQRLPGHARSAPLRKKKKKPFKSTTATAVATSTAVVSPCTSSTHKASRRLFMLRNSYARRGVSQSSIETVTEVTQVSLAGAKRSFVELEASSMDDESSEDYFPDDMSASSTSTNGGSSSSTASSNGSSSGRLKFVQFASHCAVVEIPHFDEYSDAQKMAMWNGSKKIRAMARINTAEYLFDGWSVETAAEEDQFVTVKGVAVHPAHVAKDRHKFLEGNKSATTEDEAEDQC